MKEGGDYMPASPRKDWSIGVIKIVSAMVIFMAGAVLGLSLSVKFTKTYFTSQTELFFPSKLYTSNCDRDCLDLKNFLKPSHLNHRMSDDELFWRASMESAREYPYYRVPKVAFMFLTRGELPLAPLWERFFKGHEGLYSIYLHAPPDFEFNVSNSSVFYGRQIPSERVFWGSVTLVDAEKRLLANALLDFSNERFVLLSESCIPVFNFPTVYKYLTYSEHSFVESYDEDSPCGHGGYSHHLCPDIKLPQWRKGSEWFELNRELATAIVGENKYYQIFKKHCRPSCYPDEHYIPTYMHMFYNNKNANRTITWVNWLLGGPHPATYGRENITANFIRTIRNNGTLCTYNSRPTSDCFLFARKFDPSALEPLLNISSTVMNF